MESKPFSSAWIVKNYLSTIPRPITLWFFRNSEAYRKHQGWIVGYIEPVENRAEVMFNINSRAGEDFDIQFIITAYETQTIQPGTKPITSFKGSEVIQLEAYNRPG
jgi:hypothetical protein